MNLFYYRLPVERMTTYINNSHGAPSNFSRQLQQPDFSAAF